VRGQRPEKTLFRIRGVCAILHAGLKRVESCVARENDVEISRSVLVPYSAEAMFDLIEQAERYPSFLPWCTAADILERNDDWVAARLQISYAKLHFEMRTRNPKRRPEWLQLRLVDGPFREFRGDWHLVPLGDLGCKVTLQLAYQTSAGLLDRVAKAAMERVFDSVVDAFVKRAEATLKPIESTGRAL
jgi:ribosome-associated toxin RatA of RatAB toxin-antitoxin module